ncbi:MAG: FAD-dependent thymidylate synthase, partial [Clostridia bacterium]|nr:FAD-dependent thymidylate synthase [Clostridia bacterium]
FKSEENEQKYREHIDYLFSEYQYFLDNGIAKEDARFLLPYCYRSNFFCSLNARELLHVLRAMLFGRGSKFPEIYNLGKQILSQVQPACPGIFADFESKAPAKSDTIDLSDFCTEASDSKSDELVELLAYTDNAEDTICIASLVNNLQISSEKASKIIEDESKAEEIINRIFACSRPRELEAIQYTFRYNRLSLASITHLVRHRMQGVMIPPLTSVDRSVHITPDSIKNNPELLERYNNAFVRNTEAYNMLKNAGESEETLVYLVLSGNTLDVVTTMNARELMLYFRLRTCTRAQWEIRDYACEALRKLRELEPMIFKHYGPSCYVDGRCPEGALTCGRAAEMKELFSK